MRRVEIADVSKFPQRWSSRVTSSTSRGVPARGHVQGNGSETALVLKRGGGGGRRRWRWMYTGSIEMTFRY